MINSKAKGTMNLDTMTIAYVLHIGYPTGIKRSESFTFQNADLLTARQNAFLKAQQVTAEKNPNDAVDLAISLVEINRTSTSDKHPVLATAFKQRLNRTSFMDGDTDLLVNMDRNSLAARSLPKSIFLTIGMERDNEPTNSLEVVEKTLTAEEQSYYQQ